LLGLKYLLENKNIYAEQKAALSSVFFFLFRYRCSDLFHTLQAVTSKRRCGSDMSFTQFIVVGEDSKVFEHSLLCLGILMTESSPESAIDQSCFRSKALTCPLTFSTLVDPVKIVGSKRNDVYNR
jgi:hypothetical protein